MEARPRGTGDGDSARLSAWQQPTDSVAGALARAGGEEEAAEGVGERCGREARGAQQRGDGRRETGWRGRREQRGVGR
jgi:hypothetical protein